MVSWRKVEDDKRKEEALWQHDPEGQALVYFKQQARHILELLVNHSYSLGEATDRLSRLRIETRDKTAAAQKAAEQFTADIKAAMSKTKKTSEK